MIRKEYYSLLKEEALKYESAEEWIASEIKKEPIPITSRIPDGEEYRFTFLIIAKNPLTNDWLVENIFSPQEAFFTDKRGAFGIVKTIKRKGLLPKHKKLLVDFYNSLK